MEERKMIVDSIDNWPQYRGLSAKLDAALKWLASDAPSACIEGRRYEIAEGVFANCSAYETKPEDKASFETHRKYIDIQCVLKGNELIDVIDRRKLTPSIEYDEGKDIAFYRGERSAHRLVMVPGIMAVLFPQDAHRPSVAVDTPSKVKKIVLKVAVE
jgi:biofilm protein TabA